MPIELNEADGYMEVTVGGGDGDAVVLTLDLWEANNVYIALCDAHPPESDAVGLAEGWSAWLQGRGFPNLSHANLFLVAERVFEGVEGFKKKHGLVPSPTPDSNGSTASPSAA